jgi:hypothetical protein
MSRRVARGELVSAVLEHPPEYDWVRVAGGRFALVVEPQQRDQVDGLPSSEPRRNPVGVLAQVPVDSVLQQAADLHQGEVGSQLLGVQRCCLVAHTHSLLRIRSALDRGRVVEQAVEDGGPPAW